MRTSKLSDLANLRKKPMQRLNFGELINYDGIGLKVIYDYRDEFGVPVVIFTDGKNNIVGVHELETS